MFEGSDKDADTALVHEGLEFNDRRIHDALEVQRGELKVRPPGLEPAQVQQVVEEIEQARAQARLAVGAAARVRGGTMPGGLAVGVKGWRHASL